MTKAMIHLNQTPEHVEESGSAPSMLYWVDSEKGEGLYQPFHSKNVAQKIFPTLDLAALPERYVSSLRPPWLWSDFSHFFG